MRLAVLLLLLPVALLSLACGDDDGALDHEWIATAKVVDKQVELNPSGEWVVSPDLDITVVDEETAAFSLGSFRYLLRLHSGSEPPFYDVSIENGMLLGFREARFRLSIRPLDASQSGYDVIVLAGCYDAMDIGADWPSSAPECN